MDEQIKDITSEMKAFKSKSKHEIEDNDLPEAFSYAVMESTKWGKAGSVLDNEKNMSIQASVCYLLSIELAMKGLLMNSGINVTKKHYGHNLSKLFNDLDADIKESLKEVVECNQTTLSGLLLEKVSFSSFEDELEYIANDFMNLRYEFETFLNGRAIYLFDDFIKNLAIKINKIAKQKLAGSLYSSSEAE